MQFKEKHRDDPRPELTSLVDIMFILIIFLTVTTTFAGSGGLDVNLPEASSQRAIEDVDKLYIVINRNGAAHVDGAPLTDAALEARLRALAAANPSALVIIQADKTSLHGRVVTVMDLAQTAGIKRLAIATEQKTESPAAPLETAPAVPGPAPPAPGDTAQQ